MTLAGTSRAWLSLRTCGVRVGSVCLGCAVAPCSKRVGCDMCRRPAGRRQTGPEHPTPPPTASAIGTAARGAVTGEAPANHRPRQRVPVPAAARSGRAEATRAARLPPPKNSTPCLRWVFTHKKWDGFTRHCADLLSNPACILHPSAGPVWHRAVGPAVRRSGVAHPPRSPAQLLLSRSAAAGREWAPRQRPVGAAA